MFRTATSGCACSLACAVFFEGDGLSTWLNKLDGLVEAIADGLRAPGLQHKLDLLEARRAELERQLHAAPPAVPRLHPNMTEVYRDRVGQLQRAMAEDKDSAVLEAVRALIARGAAPEAGAGSKWN